MTDVQVKCFLALAKQLNFTKAAKELCISQSTLSMHVAALEKNLNLTLFIRTKRNVELSPEGEILFPKLKQIEQMLCDTLQEARTLHKNHANMLRIGYMDSLGSNKFLMRILDEFRRQHPDVNVEIARMDNNELMQKMGDFGLDIAFTFDQVMNIKAGLKGKLVFESPLCVLYARDRYDESENFFTIDDLKEETFILLSQEVDPTESEYLKQMYEKYDFRSDKVIEVNSVEAQIFNVEFGVGICLSDYSSRVYGDKRFTFHPLPDLMIRCSAISKKDNPNPIVTCFFEFITEQGYVIEDI